MTCERPLPGDVVTILNALPTFDAESGVDEQILNLSELRGLADHAAVVASCHLHQYWLYVVYDCSTPRPRPLRVRDPLEKLLVGSRKLLAHTVTLSALLEAAEPHWNPTMSKSVPQPTAEENTSSVF